MAWYDHAKPGDLVQCTGLWEGKFFNEESGIVAPRKGRIYEIEKVVHDPFFRASNGIAFTIKILGLYAPHEFGANGFRPATRDAVHTPQLVTVLTKSRDQAHG